MVPGPDGTGLRDSDSKCFPRQTGKIAASGKERMDIQKILLDLQEERKRLDAAIAALQGLGSGANRFSPPKVTARKRRRMSAAARRKISAAQKKRWEKQRAAK